MGARLMMWAQRSRFPWVQCSWLSWGAVLHHNGRNAHPIERSTHLFGPSAHPIERKAQLGRNALRSGRNAHVRF